MTTKSRRISALNHAKLTQNQIACLRGAHVEGCLDVAAGRAFDPRPLYQMRGRRFSEFCILAALHSDRLSAYGLIKLDGFPVRLGYFQISELSGWRVSQFYTPPRTTVGKLFDAYRQAAHQARERRCGSRFPELVA